MLAGMATPRDDDLDSEQPRIGQPLPNARDAHIESDKLADYVLDPEHPVGKHKAAVFRQALDIERDDWEYLRDTILEALPHHPATDVREPEPAHAASTWEVLVPIQGLGTRAERRLLVITAWEMTDGRPGLVTARVAPRKRQQFDASG